MIKYVSIGAVLLILLAAAYYALSPLLIHVRIDEAAPAVVAKDRTPEATSPEAALQKPTSAPVPPSAPARVIGTAGHSGSGTVRILETETGTVVRYENFKTINGPDLYVYLANDLEAKEYVSLGVVKATEGNINYAVPTGTDIKKYKYVLVWCKTFGVLFNYADLKG